MLFLDEPTTGLDPRHRYEVWDVIRSLVAGGTTVLLTTHYLDEADQLADSISVIDHGRVIAAGAAGRAEGADRRQPGRPRARRGRRAPGGGRDPAAGRGRRAGAGRGARRLTAPLAEPVAGLTGLLRELESAEIAAEDVALRRPTLDEVFMRMTGEEVAA